MSRVREFHEAFGQDAPSGPTIPSVELLALRMRLIDEEYQEVRSEVHGMLGLLRLLSATGRAPDERAVARMQRIVKEVCDLRYVTEGALVAFGVEPVAYDEVHRSNMSKLGEDGRPIYREDGKVLKGPGYTPADPNRMFPDIIEHEEEAPSTQHDL